MAEGDDKREHYLLPTVPFSVSTYCKLRRNKLWPESQMRFTRNPRWANPGCDRQRKILTGSTGNPRSLEEGVKGFFHAGKSWRLVDVVLVSPNILHFRGENEVEMERDVQFSEGA